MRVSTLPSAIVIPKIDDQEIKELDELIKRMNAKFLAKYIHKILSDDFLKNFENSTIAQNNIAKAIKQMIAGILDENAKCAGATFTNDKRNSLIDKIIPSDFDISNLTDEEICMLAEMLAGNKNLIDPTGTL